MELSELSSTFSEVPLDDCKRHILNGLAQVEEAVRSGPLRYWAELTKLAPCSTPFQGPQWAMSWYRNYDTFEPLVIALTCNMRLAGVIPLAVEKSTGRLAFCGDGMADYRDVVALPEYRRRILSEFLDVFRSHVRRGIFSFGPTLPESDTADLLSSIAAEAGVRFMCRQHDGWRWLASESKEDPAKKKSVRYPLNYYRRNGELTARLITSHEDWNALKDEFYCQHSLRQRYAGRPVSFHSSQKRAFYDDLFEQPCAHFMVLEFNRKLIAAHFGCVWREVLYWGAPSFDVREKQYSPNLALLVLGIQNREAWGFPVGVDLTIGAGEMKQRFSTNRVDLPSVDLCVSAGDYYPIRLRSLVTRKSRQLANRVSQDSWDTKLKPGAAKLVHKLKRAREMGLAKSVRQMAALATKPIGEWGCGLVFSMGPEDLREVKRTANPDEHCTFHENKFYDLLLWNGESLEISARISEKARTIPELSKREHTLHTLLINGSLAAWGISYSPNESSVLSESGGAILEFQPGSVSLYDFYTLPEFRGRKLYQSLLAHILRQRFDQGAQHAYIGVAANNVASRKAIERVGFRLMMVNNFYRFLKWKNLKTKRL